MTARHVEKKPVSYTQRDGGHLVMSSGSSFHLTHDGATVLANGLQQGDHVLPGSPVVDGLIDAANAGKGKLNLKLQRLHHKAQLAAKGLGDAMPSAFAKPAGPKQLPAGSLEDQLAQELGGFISKGQAAQKAVDAIVLAAKPFPVSTGAELLDLEMLFESPKNPRQDFDEAGIEELAKSIVKTGGLMVAILARPVDANDLPYPDSNSLLQHYEIADGARRFRALKLLKRQKHPLGEKALVDIRPLSDAQLAEAFMTADKRKTLLPLEQARGFRNMLDVGHTVDSIASTLGVSTGTVHGRLKLLELGKKASQLLAWGTLPSALATMVGRYPSQMQEEALEHMLNGDDRHTGEGELWVSRDGETYTDDPKNKILLVGACMEWLQENFTKSLKSTPFDQKADLQIPVAAHPAPESMNADLDGNATAPLCAACPKNSRNMTKEVAGEDHHGGGKAGFCMGLPCYQAKWDATLELLRAEAKEKGDLKVLTPAQSAKALANHYQDAPYAKASEVVHEDPKKRTYGQLQAELNGKLDDGEQLRKIIATTEEGKVELVQKDELLKALAGDGAKWAKKKATAEKPYDYSAARKREEAKTAAREVVSLEVLKAAAQQVIKKGFTLPVLRSLVEAAASYRDDSSVELELFGLKSSRELDAFVEKKATMNQLLAIIYVRLAENEIREAYRGFSDETVRAAKENKIDLKAREKAALAAAPEADDDSGEDDGE